MTNPSPSGPSRRRSGGLGGLLTGPAAAPSADPQEPLVDKLWAVVDDKTGDELAHVHAPTEKLAADAAMEATGRAGGYSLTLLPPAPARPSGRAGGSPSGRAQLGSPAMLPRRRSQRPARDKLTANVSVSVLDALDALTIRDNSRKYDEVEEALRAHLKAKGVPIEED
ncbi:hypothetical protein AB0M39_38065 [Streptomyces sp. NPDC051907]|uniref:hypothetical protein n=1 Tax=Streptomyces sp. NPDC051907 TaxID=3155284 RepID=UPI00342FA63F